MVVHFHIGRGARHQRLNIHTSGQGAHVKKHKIGSGIYKLKHAMQISEQEPEPSNLNKLRSSLKRLNIGHGQKTKYISF